MYHYVYKIIQLSTRREYIGVHSTEDFNDNYMGSGPLIVAAYNKNPDDFVKTIIKMCRSKKEAYSLEEKLVTEEYLQENFPHKTFNQIPGGKLSKSEAYYFTEKIYKEKGLKRVGKDIRKNLSSDLLSNKVVIDGKTYEFNETWLKKTPRKEELYDFIIESAKKKSRTFGWPFSLSFPNALIVLREDFTTAFKGYTRYNDLPSDVARLVQCLNGWEMKKTKFVKPDGFVIPRKCGSLSHINLINGETTAVL